MSRKTGAELIAQERRLQLEDDSRSAGCDDKQTKEELVFAGLSYAAPDYDRMARHLDVFNFRKLWPWDVEDNTEMVPTYDQGRPKDPPRIRALMIAGALLAAEIDRLRRLPCSCGRASGKETGVELIAIERDRQLTKEKPWTAEHDDGHDKEDLVFAALSFAAPDYEELVWHEGGVNFRRLWPWKVEITRHSDSGYCQGRPSFKKVRVENLTIAGAFLAAEIDRLRRQPCPDDTNGDGDCGQRLCLRCGPCE